MRDDFATLSVPSDQSFRSSDPPPPLPKPSLFQPLIDLVSGKKDKEFQEKLADIVRKIPTISTTPTKENSHIHKIYESAPLQMKIDETATNNMLFMSRETSVRFEELMMLLHQYKKIKYTKHNYESFVAYKSKSLPKVFKVLSQVLKDKYQFYRRGAERGLLYPIIKDVSKAVTTYTKHGLDSNGKPITTYLIEVPNACKDLFTVDNLKHIVSSGCPYKGDNECFKKLYPPDDKIEHTFKRFRLRFDTTRPFTEIGSLHDTRKSFDDLMKEIFSNKNKCEIYDSKFAPEILASPDRMIVFEPIVLKRVRGKGVTFKFPVRILENAIDYKVELGIPSNKMKVTNDEHGSELLIEDDDAGKVWDWCTDWVNLFKNFHVKVDDQNE